MYLVKKFYKLKSLDEQMLVVKNFHGRRGVANVQNLKCTDLDNKTSEPNNWCGKSMAKNII